MRAFTLRDLAFLGGGLPVESIPYDDFDDYAEQMVVDNTLFGGVNGTSITWGGNWIVHVAFTGIKAWDDFDDYSDGANLDTLDGGIDMWDGPWVVHAGTL